MKKIILVLLLLLLPLACFAEQKGSEYYKDGKHYYKPANGFVPDETTAIRIAEAVWLPIYGEDIYSKKPFAAQLKDNIWFIRGSLPEGWKGGVPECEISKDTGEILRVSHGK